MLTKSIQRRQPRLIWWSHTFVLCSECSIVQWCVRHCARRNINCTPSARLLEIFVGTKRIETGSVTWLESHISLSFAAAYHYTVVCDVIMHRGKLIVSPAPVVAVAPLHWWAKEHSRKGLVPRPIIQGLVKEGRKSQRLCNEDTATHVSTDWDFLCVRSFKHMQLFHSITQHVLLGTM